MAIATFAAGCFWGVEETFRQLKGVTQTTVGYRGGALSNPTYSDVCSGQTGHAEAVQIEFDPEIISYETLLNTFWKSHDPTTLNRQGPDVGSQYRSVIFYHDETQRKLAEKSKSIWQNQFDRPIVTEITEAGPFYKAEEYHQQYLRKKGLSHCRVKGR